MNRYDVYDENHVKINTIISEREFAESYAKDNNYTLIELLYKTDEEPIIYWPNESNSITISEAKDIYAYNMSIGNVSVANEIMNRIIATYNSMLQE